MSTCKKVFCLSYLLLAAVSFSQNTGVLTVQVHESGSTRVLANVNVSIFAAGNESKALITNLTGADGKLTLTGLASGRYIIRAELPGYAAPQNATSVQYASLARQIMGQETPPSFTLPYATASAFISPLAPSMVDLQLMRAAAINGNVLDPTGRRSPSAQVTLFEVAYRAGERRIAAMGTAKTDSDGRYQFTNVAPGEFYLLATADKGSGFPHASAYYPRFANLDLAVPIRLRAGMELSSIDIRLEDQLVYRLQGRAIAPKFPSSATVTEIFVVRMDSDKLQQPPTRRLNIAPPNADGTFVIEHLAPGRYRILPVLISPDGEMSVTESIVEVKDRDVDGVITNGHPTIDFRGRIRNENGDAIARIPVTFDPLTPPINPAVTAKSVDFMGGTGRRIASVGATGEFTVKLLEGAYELGLLPLPSGLFLHDLLIGGKSVLQESLIRVDADTRPLDIVLKTGGGTVGGVVVTQSGSPVPYPIVVLAPSEAFRRNYLLYQRVVGDALGNFSIRSIRPGDYRIRAFDHLPKGAEWDSDYLQRGGLGSSVVIRTNGQETIRVTISNSQN